MGEWSALIPLAVTLVIMASWVAYLVWSTRRAPPDDDETTDISRSGW